MSKWGTGKFATLLFCPIRRRPRWNCPCEGHKGIRESGGIIPPILTSALHGGVLGNFKVTYSFCPHSVALGSTHPLTEKTTKEFPWGVKCGRRIEQKTLPSWLCQMSKQERKPKIPPRLWVFKTCYGESLLFTACRCGENCNLHPLPPWESALLPIE